MNKISLIIQREYLSRVMNKRFLLTTILMPILMVGFFAGATFLSISGKDEHKIAVVDNNGYFKGNLQDTKDIHFEFPENVDTTNYLQKGFTDIIIIPKFEGTIKTNYIIRSKKRISIGVEDKISDRINASIEDKLLQESIWKIRRSSYGAMRFVNDPGKYAVPCIEDIIVPIANFDKLIDPYINDLVTRQREFQAK